MSRGWRRCAPGSPRRWPGERRAGLLQQIKRSTCQRRNAGFDRRLRVWRPLRAVERGQLRRVAARRFPFRLWHRAEPEDQARYVGRSGTSAVAAEVLTTHGRRLLPHPVAETLPENPDHPAGQRLGIERCRGVGLAQTDHRHPVLRHPGRDRLALRDAPDRIQHLLAGLGRIAAHRQFQRHLVGDDVALGAAIDMADRDHGGVLRVHLA